MAAAAARSGTRTNTPTRNRPAAEVTSGSTSGSGVRWGPGPGVGGPVRRVSGTAVMVVLALLGRRGRGNAPGRGRTGFRLPSSWTGYAYVTVTYETVSSVRGLLRFHQEVEIGRAHV